MLEQTLSIDLTLPGRSDNATSQLRQEYQAYQNLFEHQPVAIQQNLEAQAELLTKALIDRAWQVHYSLPSAITLRMQGQEEQTISITRRIRYQNIGGLVNRLVHLDLLSALKERLSGLENSLDPAVSASAVLLRHAVVMYMVHSYLPAGRNIQYRVMEGDEIPYTPIFGQADSSSSLREGADITPGQAASRKEESSTLNAARNKVLEGFFLPQWVVVDDQQNLLARDTDEAEAALLAMKKYLSVLIAAETLAPYIVVDEQFQNKRYGILGQLVNQGRALASYEVEVMCETINRRSAAHDLDRGLSISLPYFNEDTLSMESLDFDVIPGGRVMFLPSFVVLAARAQGLKVAQNTRLNQSTRKNLLKELSNLERSFLK